MCNHKVSDINFEVPLLLNMAFAAHLQENAISVA